MASTFIGEEYIEDAKSDVGKVIGYKCTLCDCRFNDVVARTAHVKGRRHRLNYKVFICFPLFTFNFRNINLFNIRRKVIDFITKRSIMNKRKVVDYIMKRKVFDYRKWDIIVNEYFII